MNAKEARIASNAGIERKRNDEIQARRRENAKQKQIDKEALSHFKDVLKTVKRKIRIEADRGERSCRWQYDNAALAREIADTLRKEDYQVIHDHYEGYENYGDFNAPCNIWEERSWLVISW